MICSLPAYLHIEDLWAHLASASGKPVVEVMSAWTKRLGYPVLSVEGVQVRVNFKLLKCNSVVGKLHLKTLVFNINHTFLGRR